MGGRSACDVLRCSEWMAVWWWEAFLRESFQGRKAGRDAGRLTYLLVAAAVRFGIAFSSPPIWGRQRCYSAAVCFSVSLDSPMLFCFS